MNEDAQRRIAELEAEVAAQKERYAALEAIVAAKDAQIAALEKQVKELLERLTRNSGNSNKPPSSDPPAARAQRRKNKGKSGLKRGAQPGHDGSSRALLPVEEVDHVVDFFPTHCENCCTTLPETPDPLATRYQATDVPPIKPVTTEYRVHAVDCPTCGFRTCAAHDQVPVSQFGPRLSAIVALLTGVYHVSRRAAVSLLHDVVGVRISLGAVSAIEARVSAAVEPAVTEAREQVVQAAVKHTDGTSWFQAGAMRSLWTIATTAATVFKIVANGKMETLKALFGNTRGILVSDRATALTFWAMERRQICWAHLLRKFIAFSELAGPAGVVGRELLEYLGIMFAYWDDVKTGKLSRAEFRTLMVPLRTQVEALLQRAVNLDIAPVSGSCADVLEHRLALWTFVDRDDVEPTNNHAERELRAFVMWRKRSFGTQSDRGNLFAERLMTVAHTARKQHVNVLAFLVACCTAVREGGKTPSLFKAA